MNIVGNSVLQILERVETEANRRQHEVLTGVLASLRIRHVLELRSTFSLGEVCCECQYCLLRKRYTEKKIRCSQLKRFENHPQIESLTQEIKALKLELEIAKQKSGDDAVNEAILHRAREKLNLDFRYNV